MKTPLSLYSCPFFLKDRKFLTTKLTKVMANVALTMLLAASAFAKRDVMIVTTSLPNAAVGTFYSGTVTAIDGCTPYKWSII